MPRMYKRRKTKVEKKQPTEAVKKSESTSKVSEIVKKRSGQRGNPLASKPKTADGKSSVQLRREAKAAMTRSGKGGLKHTAKSLSLISQAEKLEKAGGKYAGGKTTGQRPTVSRSGGKTTTGKPSPAKKTVAKKAPSKKVQSKGDGKTVAVATLTETKPTDKKAPKKKPTLSEKVKSVVGKKKDKVKKDKYGEYTTKRVGRRGTGSMRRTVRVRKK